MREFLERWQLRVSDSWLGKAAPQPFGISGAGARGPFTPRAARVISCQRLFAGSGAQGREIDRFISIDLFSSRRVFKLVLAAAKHGLVPAAGRPPPRARAPQRPRESSTGVADRAQFEQIRCLQRVPDNIEPPVPPSREQRVQLALLNGNWPECAPRLDLDHSKRRIGPSSTDQIGRQPPRDVNASELLECSLDDAGSSQSRV